MRSRNEQQSPGEPNAYNELQVLTEVEASSDITQRKLSQRVGIALGLTNTLVRNLVNKGYIRSQKASWKRWVYALTPEGLSHKVKLTVTYVRRVIDDYQTVRHILSDQLGTLSLHQESRIAIFGTGEFAELVYLGLREIGLEEIDVFATNPTPSQRFLGIPVQDISSIRSQDYDQILVASLNQEPTEELARVQKESGDPEKLFTFFTINNAKGEEE